MARKGRIVGIALILFLVYLLSSRKPGSHPRDLRPEDDSTHDELSHPVMKDFLGEQDPIRDKLKEEHKSGKDNVKGMDQKINTAAFVGLEFADEGITRKTPKKEAQILVEESGNVGIEPGIVSKKNESDGVVALKKKEIVLNKYDAEKGIMIWSSF
jgi:hypothetical protein